MSSIRVVDVNNEETKEVEPKQPIEETKEEQPAETPVEPIEEEAKEEI